MTIFSLHWALPKSWLIFDLMRSDVEDQIRARVASRLEESGWPAEMASSLGDLEIGAARQARAAGVLLWASYAEGTGAVEDPMKLLSLTLALAELPEGRSTKDRVASAGDGPTSMSSPARPDFIGSVKPLQLGWDDVLGFWRERRLTWHPPGEDVSIQQYQAQAFAVPRGAGIVAVTSVTTAYPQWEREARISAHEFTQTLTFTPVEAPAS